MNDERVWRERVSPDAEQSAANNESARREAEPEREMTQTSRSRCLPTENGDAKTENGGKCRHDDEGCAPRSFEVLHILQYVSF